jgi:hypothetical protein
VKFRIEIDCSNDAFHEDETLHDEGIEIARILRETADLADVLVLYGGENQPIRDVNGNTVGRWSYTDD